MIIARKIANRGSYVHYSRFFDSIEDLVENIYIFENIEERENPSKLKRLKKNINKFLNRLNIFSSHGRYRIDKT